MSSFKHLLRETAFLIIALSLFLVCIKGSYIPTGVSHVSSDPNLAHSESTSFYDDPQASTARMGDAEAKDAKQESENSTRSNLEEKLNEFFNPFLAFPFFPFHFPNLRRDISQLNSTEKTIRIEKDNKLTGTRRKPFLFFDFAFNIREVPQKNQTDELKSTVLAQGSPKKVSAKSEVKKDIPFSIIDDDWSFFDDSPLLSPDMDEFLPKSDFLFFDFPFHRKQSKKLVRNKRDMTRPGVDSDLNLFVDIFDEALSRTKKEMERPEPLWLQMDEGRKNVRGEDQGGIAAERTILGDDMKVIGGGKYENKAVKGIKRSPYESIRHKNPVILGKVLKFGEIHFGEDYPKTKKKRRSASATGKKGNHGIQETSIEMIQMNEPLRPENFPKYLELSPLHTSLKDVFHRIHQDHQENLQVKEHKESHSAKLAHKSEDAKILDLMTQWDRREMEQMARASTQKSETAQPYAYNYKQHEPGRSGTKISDEGFKSIGHKPNGRYPARDSVGFEILKPQASFARHKRQESDDDAQENATPSKEEVRRNITHVLGQFFSMIRKLGDSESFYQDKENAEVEDVNWPELDDIRGSGSYAKAKKQRRARDLDDGEDDKPHPVADLNYLFLTVTLPTMFAFTLLLLVCFFNLRVRGWLCTKLFKPRHVYVVEGDVEKADKPPVLTKEMIEENLIQQETKPSGEEKTKHHEKHKVKKHKEKVTES